MADQKRMPLVEALEAFGRREPTYFAIPGHRFERGVSPELRKRWGDGVFRYDLTEADGLDDLHHPEGAILEAQKLAAELYGADRTWFLVNGTTCGNEAMILSAVKPGEKIIVPRNAHKSALMGLVLSRGGPGLGDAGISGRMGHVRRRGAGSRRESLPAGAGLQGGSGDESDLLRDLQ